MIFPRPHEEAEGSISACRIGSFQRSGVVLVQHFFYFAVQLPAASGGSRGPGCCCCCCFSVDHVPPDPRPAAPPHPSGYFPPAPRPPFRPPSLRFHMAVIHMLLQLDLDHCKSTHELSLSCPIPWPCCIASWSWLSVTVPISWSSDDGMSLLHRASALFLSAL